MRIEIVVAEGDGIGPEVVAQAVRALERVARLFGHRFEFVPALVGGACIVRHGVPLQEETLQRARDAHAVLFGAVGDPRFDDPELEVRPEQAILGLRRALGLFANLRPIRVSPSLTDAGPLRPEIVRGTDMMVVRELTGGIYFGRPQRRWDTRYGRRAVDTLRYTETEIVRILRVAFKLARRRRRRLTSVDKANVLASSRLWRELVGTVAPEFPEVTIEHMLVDACAMALVRQPSRFDVIVTENMFGDILTDEASVLAGSIGLIPSASLGRRRANGTAHGLFEPIHGSAPDLAGSDRADPVGAVLSAALLLRHSCGLEREAVAIERAVESALHDGCRTADLSPVGKPLSTSAMGAAIADRIVVGPEAVQTRRRASTPALPPPP